MSVESQEVEKEAIDFDQHLDAFKAHMATKGQVVLTKEERQKEIDEAVKGTHSNYEKEIAALTGKVKPDGVGGLQWLKTDLVPKPATPAKVEEEKQKPVEIKDDVAAAELKLLKKELEDLKTGSEKKDQEALEKTTTIGLRSSLKGIKQWGDDAEVSAKKQASAEKLIKGDYDIKLDENNELVLFDKTTKEVKMDSATQKPMTIEGLMASEFKYLLAEEKVITPRTGGTGTKQETVEKVIDGKNGIIAKDIQQIREAAAEKGLVKGSEAYNDFFLASTKLSKLEY